MYLPAGIDEWALFIEDVLSEAVSFQNILK